MKLFYNILYAFSVAYPFIQLTFSNVSVAELAGNAGCLKLSKPFNKIIIPQVQKPFLATTVNWKTFINW